MFKMEIYFNNLEDDTLKKFEKKWHIKFPKEYRTFLLKYNGGRPDIPNVFSFDYINYRDASDINGFFGINVPESYEYNHHLKFIIDRIPKELFPIAFDSGGNKICIGVSGSREGKIYFWDHELEHEDPKEEYEWYQNVFFIADSFHQFINNLTDNSE